MSKFYDIEQRSDEWFQLRAGLITGSASAVMSAESTKGFKDLVNRLASERVHGKRMETDAYISNDMQNGIDNEDTAVDLFTEETFINVTNGGFWKYSDTVGDSPDGNIKNGTLEVKVVKYNTIEKYFEDDKVPAVYKFQCQHHLLCSDSEIGYFVAYHELYKLFIVKYGIDAEYREKMIDRFKMVNELVETRMKQIKQYIK